MSEFFTMNEMVEKLKLTRQTIRKYSKEGRLPNPTKVGRVLRYAADKVEEAMKALQENPVRRGPKPKNKPSQEEAPSSNA